MFDDRVVIVTGAARGIGRATARLFAERGAAVVVADVERDHPDGAPTDELVDGLFVETDVSSPEAVEAMVDRVVAEYERLDVLVNNAGIHAMDDAATELSPEHWNRIIGVNLTGTFLCSKFALPALIATGGGSIVNVSSVAGYQASKGTPAYCSSKAGVANLTKQLALDYAADGVRVNSVHPGIIETAMTAPLFETEKGATILSGVPDGTAGRPEDVAEVIAFLASEQAGYVNGHGLVVDGGLTTKYY